MIATLLRKYWPQGRGALRKPGGYYTRRVQQFQQAIPEPILTLMHTYEQLFFGKKVVAQLLLSGDDFTSPVRYRNLQNTLRQLLELGVIPIVNENDSVSVRELVGAFGDNDELSALLARAVKADWLLLLTDVDGFYTRNGKKEPRLLRTVRKLTPDMEALCDGHGKLGTGGMRSKLRAARRASEAGAPRCEPHRAEPRQGRLVIHGVQYYIGDIHS